MSDWRPISSAPLDGTVVQVWTDLGEWRPWATFDTRDRRWKSTMEMAGTPTHWMPTPGKPEET